jgi:hypothetical protein
LGDGHQEEEEKEDDDEEALEERGGQGCQANPNAQGREAGP